VADGENLARVAAQFFAAACELAWSTESLQERLADAYADHLLAITNDDLPADLQPVFRELEAAMNRDDVDTDEDPFLAAARTLTDDQAKALIERILLLYARLASSATS
jgi:hypothetical protein